MDWAYSAAKLLLIGRRRWLPAISKARACIESFNHGSIAPPSDEMFKHCLVSEGMRLCRGHKGFEEVRVPAVATAQPGPGEKKVLIEELPEWAQLPFDGYKCAL